MKLIGRGVTRDVTGLDRSCLRCLQPVILDADEASGSRCGDGGRGALTGLLPSSSLALAFVFAHIYITELWRGSTMSFQDLSNGMGELPSMPSQIPDVDLDERDRRASW
jgi:hypothetical protein